MYLSYSPFGSLCWQRSGHFEVGPQECGTGCVAEQVVDLWRRAHNPSSCSGEILRVVACVAQFSTPATVHPYAGSVLATTDVYPCTSRVQSPPLHFI